MREDARSEDIWQPKAGNIDRWTPCEIRSDAGGDASVLVETYGIPVRPPAVLRRSNSSLPTPRCVGVPSSQVCQRSRDAPLPSIDLCDVSRPPS
jgi:hypothetical protein